MNFDKIIYNLMKQEMVTRNDYLDKIMGENYPEVIGMNIYEKREFIKENNIEIRCNHSDGMRSEYFLYDNGVIVDGFEMIVNYDEMTIFTERV